MGINIYIFRGQRVMLDEDLAKIYGVETKILNQTVKRNLSRFPDEFMFQLTLKEARNLKTASICTFPDLRSQIVTSSFGGRRYKPFVFTEHGTVMLASVLRSERAVQMSIEVVKAFVQMRHAITSQKDILEQLSEVRSFILKQTNRSDREFKKVWKAIEGLRSPADDDLNGIIGFKIDGE